MLTSVTIKNFKSIESVELALGRVNVLIGENGAGKSNILEAIALAGAACADKLDNEFLASRGIRVTDPHLMRSAFTTEAADLPVEVEFMGQNNAPVFCRIYNNNQDYCEWSYSLDGGCVSGVDVDNLLDKVGLAIQSCRGDFRLRTAAETFLVRVGSEATRFSSAFIIYSPENTSLRTFEREGQIEPLGINGEGLFKLLGVLFDSDAKAADSIREGLRLFGWFKDLDMVRPQAPMPGGIQVTDRFVETAHRFLDQKSVNEGFLFLLFYAALFSTSLTPRFFAVDNVDASLNPKLCLRLMTYLTQLAKDNGKQVILTTHNPAILDGMNLDDDEQRLFVVSRGGKGQTRVRRIEKKGPADVRLSEAFLNGALGGLPKGF